MVAEVLGEFGGFVGGFGGGFGFRWDHRAGRGERIHKVNQRSHRKTSKFTMEVVLVGQEKQAAVVKKRIEDSPNPPMLIHISRLSDRDKIDSDILALGLHQQHIGIEFLHRVGFTPKDFGVPPIVEVEYLFGGGRGRGFGPPGFEYDHSLERIHPNDGDGGVGAHFFEGVGALFLARGVQKTVDVEGVEFDASTHDLNLHPRRIS